MGHFGQEIFELAQKRGGQDEDEYRHALAAGRRLAGAEGLDAAALDGYRLDALIAPTGGPAWPLDPENGDSYHGGSSRCAAVAGYPLITVPAGFVARGEDVELPVGLTFMGRAWSEAALVRLAYAFERATQRRRPPDLLSVERFQEGEVAQL